MIVPDVNVLVYAARDDALRHPEFRDWLHDAMQGPEAVGLSELALSGVVRVLTHPRVFDPPMSLGDALAYVDALRRQPRAIPLRPGSRRWAIFVELCRVGAARGNLVPDAYHAALAMEAGAEWITTDRDFARFPGLRWRHPFK
ncbi:MAG: type II toxin-antitoxin system VapC family toxin [Gemmatimonas sp.]